MKAVYHQWRGNYWGEETIQKLINKFPEGQIVIKVDGIEVGCALSTAVFTSCDFSFPANGFESEAKPNTEMVLIADVDLSFLYELHARVSVRNLKDKGTDFYELTLKEQASL